MSCRRLRRELIELFRFGGLDWRSAPHLDHLADCRACRDEVGFDRVLVQQLRAALAERVAGSAPSADAWAAVLARAQAPSVGPRSWLRAHSVSLVARLGAATAVSALAIVISTGTDVAIRLPAGWPEGGAARVLVVEQWETAAARPATPDIATSIEAASGSGQSADAGYRPPEFAVDSREQGASDAGEGETSAAAPATGPTLVARPWSPVGEPLHYGPADDAASASADRDPPEPTPPAQGPF
ncbi:MAG: hypothetical protein ACRDGJ_00385 [Candidatus Limnocylindria bacterium]